MSSDAQLQEHKTRLVARQAKLFRGLADPSRLAILEALRGGAISVGAIVSATGLTQSNVSNHLRCLNECGLVEGEPRGRFVHYQLADPRVDELLALASQLLDSTGERIDICGNYRST